MTIRGVDLDLIAIQPAPETADIKPAVDAALAADGYERLASIDDVRLDVLQEWCKPTERCVALTEPQNGWRLIYDTRFNHSALAAALSKALPDARVVQVNLQEITDLTLRVLRGGEAVYEYSNAPAFFQWGRGLSVAESAAVAHPDAERLARAFGLSKASAVLADAVAVIAAKTKGERMGPQKKRSGGAQDAVDRLAAEVGLPKLYRFFEGWMRSDLDWDEDLVETVWAYRNEGLA